MLILTVFSITVISLMPNSLEQKIALTTNTTMPINTSDISTSQESTAITVIRHPSLAIGEVKPWYGMFLESDQVRMVMAVANLNNESHTYYLIEKVSSLTDAKLTEVEANQTHYDQVTVAPNSATIVPYSQQFGVGSWKLFVQVANTYNGTVLDSQTKFFVVQPVQDYFVLLGVISSGMIGGGTIAALVLNVKFSRKQVSELKTQNTILKTQNEDLKKLSSIQNRPWIGMDNSSGSQIEYLERAIVFRFINHGKTPALNVIITTLMKTSLVTEDEVITEGRSSNAISITPNEVFIEYVNLPKGVTVLSDILQFYVGIHIKYTYDETKTGKLFTVIYFDKENDRKNSYVIRKLE